MFRATQRQIAMKLNEANKSLRSERVTIQTAAGRVNYEAFDVLMDGVPIAQKIPKIAVYTCLSGIIAAANTGPSTSYVIGYRRLA
jgi:hypothetical protein